MRILAIDYSNSGGIHRFLGHEVINLKTENNFDYKKKDIYWLCDNHNITINKIFEELAKYRGIRVFNNTSIYQWGSNRVRGMKVAEKIFKDCEKVKLLNYKLYRNKEEINKEDWKGKVVVKLNTSDAGYKRTMILNSIDEIDNIEFEEEFMIQEYCKGEEIAFGTLFIDSEPVLPVYISFEFKRSISNKIGKNTGQSAEFGVFTGEYIKPEINELALKIIHRIEDYLKRNAIKYTGTIDINGGLLNGIFYPYEWTVSRDGYPEILSFLYEQDLEKIIYEKRFDVTNPFKYILVIRRDKIEEDKILPEKFEVKNGSWVFVNETIQIGNKYLIRETDLMGLMYKESTEFIIPVIDFDFNIPYIYYASFKEDVERKWGLIRKV